MPWHRKERLSMTTQADDHRHSPQLIPRRLLRGGQLHHPAVLEEAKRRSEKFQLRLADRITSFAGSMNFVWLHAVVLVLQGMAQAQELRLGGGAQRR
ncbi:MAG: hypothetical protein B7X07_07400, partial [Actinobacteria bacterium 21-64-8]